MPLSKLIQRNLLLLLMFSALVRALTAGLFELGNDEVYYWTYAVYPDLSYFDHPPMVGWLIRIFTFNLHFQQEFFIRLASIIGGTLNTWLIYLIGKKLRDTLTGWYAALLYTASIYGFIITGTFILPDTPQTVFWLLALLLMLDLLPEMHSGSLNKNKMLLIGVALGLGMLSKYTTAFLWMGMVLFILLFNRNWLRQWRFYAASFIMAGLFSIVIVWNAMNHFISFTYQGGRAEMTQAIVNIDSFLTEIGGEILYTNPVNFILILLSLLAVFRTRSLRQEPKVRILLLSGLPIIGIFMVLSLFRNTLPHWSGPGYMSLIPIAALWIRQKTAESGRLFPVWPLVSLATMAVILLLAIAQISTGFIHLDPENVPARKKGEKDYSLEVYGWTQMGEEFRKMAGRYEKAGEMPVDAPIVTYRWFPAANLEYYATRPGNRIVMAAGDLEAIHNYSRINRMHGGFRLNTDAWYITSSRDFRDPVLLMPFYYRQIMPPDTINIDRCGKTAYYFFVYRMKDLQSKPGDGAEKSLR